MTGHQLGLLLMLASAAVSVWVIWRIVEVVMG